jgi:hypothetical protein
MRRSPSRLVALLLACVPVAAGGLVLLFSLYGLLAQCDEACTGGDWQHTGGAWQWKALAVLGVLTVVLTLAFFASVVKARPWRGLAALAGSALVALLAFARSGDNWMETLEHHSLLLAAIALVLGAGFFAAMLCGEPHDLRGRTRRSVPRDES